MKTKYIITTDSCADVRKEWCKENHVEVIPCFWSYEQDGEVVEYNTTYIDDFEAVSPEAFYQGLAEKGAMARTSVITKERFVEFFRRAIAKARGEDKGAHVNLVHIGISKGMSQGTWDNATEAAKEIKKKERDGCNIVLIDSCASSFLQRVQLERAVEMGKAGRFLKNFDENTAEIIRWRFYNLGVAVILGDLKFLQRTGRTTRMAAWAGGILGIKPVVRYDEESGKAIVFAKTRRKGMWRFLEEQFGEKGKLHKIWIASSGGDAENSKAELLTKFEEAGIEAEDTGWIGPVSGAHIGPGTVYVVWEKD